MKKPPSIHGFDYPMLLIAATLLVLGCLMVFSASVIMAEVRFKTPYLFVLKHMIWVVIGSAAMYFFAHFNYRQLQKYAKYLGIIAVILLIAVLIFGTSKGGARRWFQWGFISFQPSEFAKLTLVIVMADFLDRKKSRLQKWKGLLPILSITGLFCFLVALEPDLGTPVIMVSASIFLLYIAGARLSHIAALAAACVPFVALEILRKPYRLMRVKSFLQSLGDIESTSYQINQSILALGSGGFWGKGLAHGELKLLYLPEPHTDFIFPIIGEELGFLGSTVIIALFLLFAWRGWMISRNSSDFFGGILGTGITLIITFQALLNIAVACGLMPAKGLPLPFVSFGGTALVINMAELGILLSISRKTAGKQISARFA